jgi:hypothetical protein
MITTTQITSVAALCALLLLAGCPSDKDSSGSYAAGSGGQSVSHVGGSGGSSGGGGSVGTHDAGPVGVGGGSAVDAGGNDCAGMAIPALCKLCSDNACGKPSCAGGKFLGFVCPDDRDAGAVSDAGVMTDAGSAGGGGVCNVLCAQGYHCEANHTPKCVADSPDAGSLRWVASCGAPVCRSDITPYDDPNIPNCTTETLGQPCSTDGARCDGVLSCGASYLCAAQAPKTCPLSRVRFKQDIKYLDDAERARFHDQITQLRLATYRYTSAAEVPQLGFMIDDVEPSVAVSGDHVNLYGYLSMAVAAIQVQDQRIQALERELAALRARRHEGRRALQARSIEEANGLAAQGRSAGQ